jgi:tetratricopeptide (TPR) repeat protein
MKTWRDFFEEGMAYGSKNDFKHAEESFREAVRLAPNEPYPHYELGYTLFLLKDYGAAKIEFERTNELSRGFFLVQMELYLCEQILTNQIQHSTLDLLRALQAIVDANMIHSAQAINMAREATSSAPDCALGHFYLGKALLSIDPAASEGELLRCLELTPDETTVIDAKQHIGILRLQSGDAEKAREIWESIIVDYKGNPHSKTCEILLAQLDRT